MKSKYSKNHPLWPVYDLQRQIIKRGGNINRHSDLLAFFEERSLVKNPNPNSILLNLIKNNFSNKMKELFQLEKVAYKKSIVPWNKNAWEFKRYPISKEPPSGYKTETIIENNDFVLLKDEIADNELFLNGYGCDYFLSIDPKYVDILRLIKNGYEPKIYEMRSNKNLIPAIIIAAGLIISAFIYAYSQRYEIRGSTLRIDKWIGTIERLEYKK